MKKVLLTILEPARVALVLGLAIGLGVTVHPVFFLAVLLIAAAALAETIVNAAWWLTHRHP
jgi:hypothetical protein